MNYSSTKIAVEECRFVMYTACKQQTCARGTGFSPYDPSSHHVSTVLLHHGWWGLISSISRATYTKHRFTVAPPMMSDRTGVPQEPSAIYHYHHGTGEHLLIPPDPDVHRPRYSLTCLSCYCVDLLCLLLVVGCLIFNFWLCYYIYNNYQGGG